MSTNINFYHQTDPVTEEGAITFCKNSGIITVGLGSGKYEKFGNELPDFFTDMYLLLTPAHAAEVWHNLPLLSTSEGISLSTTGLDITNYIVTSPAPILNIYLDLDDITYSFPLVSGGEAEVTGSLTTSGSQWDATNGYHFYIDGHLSFSEQIICDEADIRIKYTVLA